MKDLIVLVAVVILFSTLVLQYGLEQKNHANISKFQVIVQSSKERAKQEGCFTDEIVDDLKYNVAKAFDISVDEVIVEATSENNRKIRKELIYYKIGVPIKKTNATNKLFGIRDVNKITYYIENHVVSEYVE